MIYYKLSKTDRGGILALCDAELLGKKYEEGKMVLDLDRYGSFYKGKKTKTDSNALKRDLKLAGSMNAVGIKSITILEKSGFDVSGVKTIQGIPHLHIYKI